MSPFNWVEPFFVLRSPQLRNCSMCLFGIDFFVCLFFRTLLYHQILPILVPFVFTACNG